MKNRLFLLSFILCFCMFQQASAVNFDFDLTFDGTSISVDGGSATPAGTVLLVGDSFSVDVRASNGNLWQVVNPVNNLFIPMAFSTQESADRIGNIQSTFFLNGIQTAQIIETNINQSSVHVGTQFWSLATGIQFDTVSLVYNLLSSTSTNTTISANPDIFSSFSDPERPFFRDPDFSFETSASVVPLPASLPLFGAGLALMGFICLRRKQKAIAAV